MHDRHVLRQLACGVHPLAERAVLLAGRQFHRIGAAPGRDRARLVHAIHHELKRRRLRGAVGIASDLHLRAGGRRDAPVARRVHHHLRADRPQALRRVDGEAGHAPPLHLRVDDGRAEEHRDAGVGAEPREDALRLLVVDVLLGTVARHHLRRVEVVRVQEAADLVRHRARAHLAEDRRDVSEREVAAEAAEALHEDRLRAQTRRAHRGAHAGGSAAGHHDVRLQPRRRNAVAAAWRPARAASTRSRQRGHGGS